MKKEINIATQGFAMTFFAGGGISSNGIRNHFTEIFASDIGHLQERCFRKNFPEVPFMREDIRKLSAKKIIAYLKTQGIYLVKGTKLFLSFGSPCPDFSRANPNRLQFSERARLILECPRLIMEFTKEGFEVIALCENVQGLLDHASGGMFNMLLNELNNIDSHYYEYRVLNSLHYGVPQNRYRPCIIVAPKHYGRILFPIPTIPKLEDVLPRYSLPHLEAWRSIGHDIKYHTMDEVFNTFTATGSIEVKENGVWRRPNIKEMQWASTTLDMDFSDFSEREATLLIGNGIMSNFAEAISETIKVNYFDAPPSSPDTDLQPTPPDVTPSLITNNIGTESSGKNSVVSDNNITLYDDGILYHGDCLEIFPDIPPNSVEMVLADLPYSTTGHTWDSLIPFHDLWKEYKRVLKPRGLVVLTAASPFNAKLIASNVEWFRYDLVWRKDYSTNFANCYKQPMRNHENILVFYEKTPTFNPQGLIERVHEKEFHKDISSKSGGMFKVNESRIYHSEGKIPIVNKKENYYEGYGLKWKGNSSYKSRYTNFPLSVLNFKKVSIKDRKHPMQKPQELFEYLILSYTNEGETVLDNCVGAGTTAAASVATKRRFVVIEKDKMYHDITKKRIEDLKKELAMRRKAS